MSYIMGVKQIADKMFGLEFKEKIKDALGGITNEELNELRKSRGGRNDGRKIVREIEQIKEKK